MAERNIAPDEPRPYPERDIVRHLRREAERQFDREQLVALPPGTPVHLVIPLDESLDPLLWIARQEGATRLYWSGRDGSEETGGLGCALRVDAPEGCVSPELLRLTRPWGQPCDQKVRWFGGLSFRIREESAPHWKAFGNGFFILPRYEIRRSRRGSSLHATFVRPADRALDTEREAFLAGLTALRFPEDPPAARAPSVTQRRDQPDREAWRAEIETCLARMRAGEYQKVVLARQTSFRSDGEIEPFLLLRRLRDINPEGFHFAIQPAPGTAFIGASPERLYRRSGDLIRSEAVAGTRRRGESMAEDRAMGDALLESEKDVREHRFVADNIREHFHRLAATFDMDPNLSLLKLSRLQHLYRGFRGRLAPGVTDAEIVRSLHPTPAVAGHPTLRAVEEIAAMEAFDRGWYAGPVGWIGPGGAEFAVAIRSALIHRDRLILYAGAGIVEGSRPLAEWEELENKIAGFVRILGLP